MGCGLGWDSPWEWPPVVAVARPDPSASATGLQPAEARDRDLHGRRQSGGMPLLRASSERQQSQPCDTLRH